MKLPWISPLSVVSRKIGIDLGTSRVRIWSDQEGFLVDEPSCIAVDSLTNKVIAVGQEAEHMVGRVAPHIVISYPINTQDIHQPELVVGLLKVLLQKVLSTPYFFRPSFMVSISSDVTEVERSSLMDLLYSLGAREVYFINQVLAAAIGAGVPIADASGSFILQLGSRVVEGGIISLGSVIVSEVSQYGGKHIDKQIQRLLKKEEQISIAMSTAEHIKIQVGSALQKTKKMMNITGQDMIEVVPKEIEITSELVYPVIAEVIERYIRMARKLFEQIPPELTSDVIDKGILLSGGLAQMDGIAPVLLSYLGVSVSVVEEPDKTVIKGISQVLQNLDLFKESLGYRV